MDLGNDVSSADIQRTAWSSQIPCKLILAKDEVTAMEAPPPVYMMMPRMGWLPSLAERVFPHFQHVLPPGDNKPWFDYKGLPLRWQYPVGALYDCLVPSQEQPWCLTVHYRAFPESLLEWEGPKAMRAAYLNSLKEAAVIALGSCSPVMQMAQGTEDDLWEAVQRADVARWREVMEGLGLLAGRPASDKKFIPFRLLLRRGGRGYLTSYEGVHYTSRPMEFLRPDGEPQTLGAALLAVLSPNPQNPGPPAGPPQGSGEPAAADDGNWDGLDEVDQDADVPASSTGGEGERGNRQTDQIWKWQEGVGLYHQEQEADVRVCGMRLPLEVPIAWVHATLRHPNNFLYVVVTMS
eukprot:jgi/Botrbrau1/20778/Bobra.0156s0010.1